MNVSNLFIILRSILLLFGHCITTWYAMSWYLVKLTDLETSYSDILAIVYQYMFYDSVGESYTTCIRTPNYKDADQLVQMNRLISSFVVCMC